MDQPPAATTLLSRFPPAPTDPGSSWTIPLERGEKWWGGAVVDGPSMPFDEHSRIRCSLDATTRAAGNQAQPLLISSTGRYVWNEHAFNFEFRDGQLILSGATTPWQVGGVGSTLREAFLAAAGRFFPTAHRMPPEIMFTAPQYNTWIELLYDQTQEKILNYARALIAHGYPPGVLMIDDNWQEDYGTWEFSRRRFADPKAMIAELHALGFQVMLWVCPFVSADSATYRELAREGWLLRDPKGSREVVWIDTPNDAAMIRWWNGVSAVLDLSHPQARAWFKNRLQRLMKEFGVDGFKFDAGDSNFYAPADGDLPFLSFEPRTPQEHTMDFGRLGLDFPLNEYRACWKLAGQPLAQRLRDKDHSWNALRELIPGVIAQGMMGYAFSCPDMIGGGLAGAFDDPSKFDPELVVRSAQVHALMPMMQFSVAPWRTLDPEHAKRCVAAAQLRVRHSTYLSGLARKSAATGEPIAKPLAWLWPHGDYEHVRDQFMLGDDLMIAPVVTAQTRSRTVIFPPGQWRGDDGSQTKGPTEKEIPTPLDRLPYFIRQ
jgi:alpha-glucosidase